MWYFACWCCKAARGSKRGPASWARLLMHVPNIWVVISTLRARALLNNQNFHLESLCVALLLLVDLLCNSLWFWQKQWQIIFTLQSFSPRFHNIIFLQKVPNSQYLVFITNYMTKIREEIFQISERKSFRSQRGNLSDLREEIFQISERKSFRSQRGNLSDLREEIF